jgi:hypothetical protein
MGHFRRAQPMSPAPAGLYLLPAQAARMVTQRDLDSVTWYVTKYTMTWLYTQENSRGQRDGLARKPIC